MARVDNIGNHLVRLPYISLVTVVKEGNELTIFGIISHPQIPIFTLSLAITPEPNECFLSIIEHFYSVRQSLLHFISLFIQDY